MIDIQKIFEELNRADGFKKIKICPYLPESMHEFKCTYRSAAGEISVQVKEEQDGLVLQVKVPDGVEYQIDTTNLESSREIVAEKIKIEVELKVFHRIANKKDELSTRNTLRRYR